jgi:hypothetical protein
VQVQGRGALEEHVGDAQPRDLGDAGAGVVEGGEHHRVALATPGGPVRGGEQGFDLLAREEAEDGAVEPLGRDGADALGDGERGGVADGRVAHEGADGGKAQVAGARGVAALALEVVKEGEHPGCVEVVEDQRRGRPSGALLEVTQQELEGVPVAGDGLGARVPLGDQALVEEVLQERGEGDLRRPHEASSGARRANCSKRCAVMAMSSGTAEKYQ